MELPSATIQYVSVDNEQTTVFDRDSGVFTDGDPAARVRRPGGCRGTSWSRRRSNRGILEQADTNAREALSRFLEGLGYTDVVFVEESTS